MIARAINEAAAMTSFGPIARTDQATSRSRAPEPAYVPRSRLTRRLSWFVAIISLMGVAGPAQALGRFEWYGQTGDFLHTVSSGPVMFHSYEESLLALRASTWQGIPLWKNVDPFGGC